MTSITKANLVKLQDAIKSIVEVGATMGGKNTNLLTHNNWAEVVIRGVLGHKDYTGGFHHKAPDGVNPVTNKFTEYKSATKINDELNDYLVKGEIPRYKKNGKGYIKGNDKPVKVGMVYNGAYGNNISPNLDLEHYLAMFYKGALVRIIQVDSAYVTQVLTTNNNNRGKGKTTNLNTVTIDLVNDKQYYKIVY